MKKYAMFLVALFMAVPLFTYAQDETPANGWYVGGGLGTLSIKGLKKSGFEQDLVDTPGVVSSGEIKDTSTTQSLLVGYSFNRYISVEAGYLQANGVSTETRISGYDAGTVTINNTVVNLGTISPNIVMRRQARLSVTQLSLIGKLPVTEKFDVFAKAGIDKYKLDVKSTIDLTNGVYIGLDDSQKGSVLVGSLGADYRFTKHFAGRLEYMPGKVVKITTASLLYWF